MAEVFCGENSVAFTDCMTGAFMVINNAINSVAILMFGFAMFGVYLNDFLMIIGGFEGLISGLVLASLMAYLFDGEWLVVFGFLFLALSLLLVGSIHSASSSLLILLPHIFSIFILSGMAHLLFLKWKEPATFAVIVRDLVIAKGLIHETTREAPSELSEPLFQPK